MIASVRGALCAKPESDWPDAFMGKYPAEKRRVANVGERTGVSHPPFGGAWKNRTTALSAAIDAAAEQAGARLAV